MPEKEATIGDTDMSYLTRRGGDITQSAQRGGQRVEDVPTLCILHLIAKGEDRYDGILRVHLMTGTSPCGRSPPA
jgi:hypothetical protein